MLGLGSGIRKHASRAGAMKVPLDIFSGFYESESAPFNSQRCVNCRPIVAESPSFNQKALIGTQGIVQFGALEGVNRGSILAKKVPYFVNGKALYSVDSLGNGTNLGAISGSGRVSMATNTTVTGKTIICIVVPGKTAYVYDSSLGTVAEITDPDFIVSDTVVFKDGYFFFSTSSGLQIIQSSLNDPMTFDALDTGTAEIDPDLIVGLMVNHNEMFVMGERTGELFQNVGGTGFVLQRIPGANIQKGLHAKHGLAAFDNTFVFIGGGENELPAIWKVTSSSSAVKISTSAIDAAIQKYTKSEIEDCFAMTWAVKGSFFVSFTFSSNRIANRTFVYDATSSTYNQRSIWFELQSGITNNRWRVESIVMAYGKLLTGDYTTNKIGYLDDSVFTEYGETIRREVTGQPFSQLTTSQAWDSLEIFMESGVGLTSGQGSEPVIRMSFSNNLGRSFGSEFSRSFGKIGEYNRRTVWRRQGRIPISRVIRFVCSDPVRFNVLGLVVNDEVE